MDKKRYNVFNIEGTIFLEDHEKGSYHIGEQKNVNNNNLKEIAEILNTQHETIQKLKQKIKQYEELNIEFSNIKNTYIDEKNRLVEIEYETVYTK